VDFQGISHGTFRTQEMLIAARAFQGPGAGTITPAALSIIVVTFAEGRKRKIALGAWGAVGGVASAAGVLLGGVLPDLLRSTARNRSVAPSASRSLHDRGLEHERFGRDRNRPAVALTDGFQSAFWAGTAISFAGVLVSLLLVRGRDLQEQDAVAPEPALANAIR
jgi:MFS family permease